MILAIDPGNIESAYCLIELSTLKPYKYEKVDNHKLLILLHELSYRKIVIEKVANMGMPAIGETLFDTCIWTGRFIQRRTCPDFEYIYRREVKINLCGSMRAKDTNIRQALIDRFGVVGTKKNPGWFYKFKADIWSAYAVGITYIDKEEIGNGLSIDKKARGNI